MQQRCYTERCSAEFSVWRKRTATKAFQYFALSAGGWRLSVPTGSTNFSVDSRHLPVATDSRYFSAHSIHLSGSDESR